MKRRTKILIGLVTTCAASLVFAAACATWDTPYDIFEKDGSKVKILYDANGGQFAGKEKTNIADLYSVDNLQSGIKLLEPGSDKRGNAKNLSVATRSGYFLAGWYKEIKTSSDGAEIVGYSDKWDFENDLLKQDDVSKVTAETPVLTLYAAWVPEFTYTFHVKDSSGSWKEEKVLSFSPTAREDLMSLDLPYWEDEQEGVEDKTKCSASMIYGNFPKIDGKTFKKAYFDKNMTNEATQINHKGKVAEESGTSENGNLDLYLDLIDGNWFHIFSPEQFVANARIDGSYEIYTDIDFSVDKINWRAGLMTGEFTGTFNGHGHTFSNITVTQQNDSSQMRGGIFGSIASTAVFNDIKFKNLSYTLRTASRMTGSTFGMFAGQIAAGAKFEKVEVDGVLHIGPEIVSRYSYYQVGLLCANIAAISGNLTGLTYDISCVLDARGTVSNRVWPHKATIENGMVVLEENDNEKNDPNPVN